jgi:hypothetical protein
MRTQVPTGISSRYAGQTFRCSEYTATLTVFPEKRMFFFVSGFSATEVLEIDRFPHFFFRLILKFASFSRTYPRGHLPIILDLQWDRRQVP